MGPTHLCNLMDHNPLIIPHLHSRFPYFLTLSHCCDYSCWTPHQKFLYPSSLTLPLSIFSNSRSIMNPWLMAPSGRCLFVTLNLINKWWALLIFASYWTFLRKQGISWEWKFIEGKFCVWFFFINTYLTLYWIFNKKYVLIDWISKWIN